MRAAYMKISTAQKSNAELLILDLIKDIHKLKFHEIPTDGPKSIKNLKLQCVD